MRTKQQSRQHRCASLLMTLTVMILFSCSQESLAQQWSTSGNDISNSNTGNVGVGTNSPGVKLDILSSISLIARFGSTAGAHTQVLVDAPSAYNSNLTLQRGGVSKWFMGNRASNDRLSFIESTGGVEVLTLLQNGNVGVGTSNPQDALHVFSPTNTVGTMRLQGGNASAAFIGIWDPGQMLLLTNNRHPGTGNNFNPAAAGVQISIGHMGTPGDIMFYASSSGPVGNTTELMRIKGDGNIGIGTTTPGAKLDVVGGTYNTGIRITSSSVIGSGLTINSTDTGGHEFNILATATNITGGAGGLHIFDATANAARMRISPNGDVGIGNTNPGYKLDVSGEINATGFRINGTPISTGGPGPVTWAQVDKSVSSLADIATRNAGDLNTGTIPIGRIGLSGNAGVSTFLRGDNTWGPVPSSQWTSGTNNISYSAGNVGIGTSSPDFLLDVSGSANNPFRVRDSSGREYFSTTTRTGSFGIAPVVSIASGRLIIDNNGPEGGNDTTVRRAVNSLVFAPSEHPDLPGALMVLQAGGSSILYVGQNANGNVGIGTTTPGAKLEVVGNVNVTGTGNITAAGTIEGVNIRAKYQDVAEWVESSQELSVGTLVVLDHTKSNQVIASSQAYDTRVAGVISERPGIALGEGGDNKVLVATTGRVMLTVDASNGPIQIGDLLVTSDISGVAMKSEAINVGGVQIHRPGTLVGKALEPLPKGQGKILVLLSLQ